MNLRDFDELFKEMERRMMEDFEKIFREMEKLEKSGDPRVKVRKYGISIRVGPDGKVYVKRFGDVPEEIERALPRGETSYEEERPPVPVEGGEKYRKPFVDVYEKDGKVYITVELPGVKEDEIEYEVKEGGIEVKTTGERKYKVFIPVSGEIDKDSIQKSFSNGILEIIIKTNAPKNK